MGPSGSGKTTFLDLLAGRKTQGQLEGSILFGASKPSRELLRRYVGYVEQVRCGWRSSTEEGGGGSGCRRTHGARGPPRMRSALHSLTPNMRVQRLHCPPPTARLPCRRTRWSTHSPW